MSVTAENPADVRSALSEFVRKNSLNIERLLTSASPDVDDGTHPNDQAARPAGFGALIGTKKERASVKEKQLLLKARHQRHFAEIARARSIIPETLKEPMGTLEPAEKSTITVAASLQDLKKPFGIYTSDRFFCDCEGCSSNRETQLKADKWWLAGDRDRALSYQEKPCLKTLPVAYNSVIRRKYRPRMIKGADHVAQLWKAIDGVTLNRQFTRSLSRPGPFRRTGTIDVDGYEAIDRAIEDTEDQIRRLVGSADWTAEVVVVVTSLSASRVAYQESYRLVRFFEAKGVDHIAIDVNADIGQDSIDYKLLRTWHTENLLLKDANKLADRVALPIIFPQVLVDGVPLGPLEEVLTLEDEHDLDYILAREACPNCLANRKQNDGHCRRCSALYKDLISLKYLKANEIRLLLVRSEKNACRIKAPTPYDWEKRRRQLGLKDRGEDASTWFSPDDLKRFGTPSLGFCVDFN